MNRTPPAGRPVPEAPEPAPGVPAAAPEETMGEPVAASRGDRSAPGVVPSPSVLLGPGRATGWPGMGYWARWTLTILAVIFACYVAYLLRAVAVSVLLAMFFAIGLDPVVKTLERRGLRRGLAVFLVLLGILAVLAGVFVLAIPPVVTQANELLQRLPGEVRKLSESPRVVEFINGPELQQRLSGALETLPDLVTASLSQVLGVATAIIGTVIGLLTILVLMIYFQLALPRLRIAAERLLGEQRRVRLMDEILGKISGYVVGQLSISLLAGSVAFVFLSILEVPFPALLALVTALTAAVPLVGATIGAVFVTLIVSTESIPKAIWTLLFFVIYQQLENYIVAPRVFSHAVNLPPAIVFLAVLSGATLAGFVGAILALPTAAAIKSLVQYHLRNRGDSPLRDVVQHAPGA